MAFCRRNIYAIGAALIALAGFIWLMRVMPIVEWVDAGQREVMQWGEWSAVCYPFLFALCNLLLLPGGVLSFGAGFFFGLWWGFTLLLIGNAISAVGAFAASRWALHQWFERKLANHPRLRALEPAVAKEGWKIVFLSQLHPLFPTSLISYFYGLTRVRFGTYFIWVLLGRAPGLLLYAYLGTLGQYGLNLARGRTHPRVLEYWTWGGAFVVTVLLFLVLTRLAMKALRLPD
jgi:uncharacterized membrane protein YdjX (TVP38/TMEM64 family)